jgi:hypothetical protein
MEENEKIIEAKRIINNAGFNETTRWDELEKVLEEQVKKANSITEIVTISECLISAIGQKQSILMKKIKEKEALENRNDTLSKDNSYFRKENSKLKELIGLEQFKNKVLLDNFSKLSQQKYEVIVNKLDTKEI